MLEWLLEPWPWYVSGPMIGLTVPLLLLLTGHNLGISSSLRHIGAAWLPPYYTFGANDEKQTPDLSDGAVFRDCVGQDTGGFMVPDSGYVYLQKPIYVSGHHVSYCGGGSVTSFDPSLAAANH